MKRKPLAALLDLTPPPLGEGSEVLAGFPI
jgi:hypothetical protein